MAAKATPVRTGFGPKDLGEFTVERFNMFDGDGAEKYAELRNKANDLSSGIKIEMVREYSRKTVVREGQGEDQVTTTKDEIWLVVHYWVKKPKRNKGDSDEEPTAKGALASSSQTG